MNWKEFLRPGWRKGFLFLLFSSLYLFLSYLVLTIFLSGFIAISGICSYNFFTIWKNMVHDKICPNSTDINEMYGKYTTKVDEFQTFRDNYVKSLKPILLVLNPVSGTPVELINSGQILSILLYWYLVSCLIVWIHDKYKKK